MKRYNQHNIRKGGEKMIFYVLKTRSIILVLVVLMLAVLKCECNKTTGPETPEPLEIKWQQTSLDTVVFGVWTDKSIDIVFANRALGKLVRSSDQGKTWTLSLSLYDIHHMAFKDNGDIFAFDNCNYSSRLLHSSNGGVTWDIFVAHNQPAHCSRALVFHQSGYMFLGDFGYEGLRPGTRASGGLYRSSDNGTSWQSVSFPDSIGVYSMAINDEDHIFVGTSMGIYRSTDIGDNWIAINSSLREIDGRPPLISDLAINPVNNNIFAVVDYVEVYRTDDNGNSWTKTGSELQIHPSDIRDLAINSKGEIFVAVLNNTSRPELLSGVIYSADNGDSWQRVNNGLSNTTIFYSLAIDSFGFLYVATEDGVFRTVESTTK